MSKRAIILAGGKGTRLKPYSVTLPKPLVPLGEKPILEIIIIQLREAGFEHITITVNHFAEIIKAFFGDGTKWDIKIDYTTEEKPLSTMGPLSLIRDLPENFLVMNGDVLTDINLNEFFYYHIQKENLFTIGASRREEKIDYGILHVNNEKKLVGFEEKPSVEYLVSMGIYMLNKKVTQYIPNNTFFGFDNLMRVLLDKNELPGVYIFDGYWLDIGRPADYEKAHERITKQYERN
ncbi:MAG TPA: sugar phosphate nucleotidyltransferase [Ignavibacteriaceae bacterium]|nr:sugar phosphate nucleotidyltransferase [Ignavibacteriaceae bacterium]